MLDHLQYSESEEPEYNQGMNTNTTELELMKLLRQQVQRAMDLDGSTGPQALQARKDACAAANATMDILCTEHGVCGEDVMDEIFRGAAF